MTKVLVTGSRGFMGKNLCAVLRGSETVELAEYDLGDGPEVYAKALATSEVIIHMAGINRPPSPEDYEPGNAGATAALCAELLRLGRAPKILFASSIQAELDNPYGVSKRHAEEVLREFASTVEADVTVLRLKNIFGKWCRPDYNSVTATFCYNIAHDLPIQISDPAREVDLTYVDEVVAACLAGIESPHCAGFRLACPLPSMRVSLGRLAELIGGFRNQRVSLELPDCGDSFVRTLYATYLSYVEPGKCLYGLEVKSDSRGSLAEFIKSPHAGQVFVSRTAPGVTRGNHFHHTKVEKFLVVEGAAMIRLRQIEGQKVVEHHVRGEEYKVVDIPPGYTHSIQNVGATDLVTLFWTSQVFDSSHPDTYALNVQTRPLARGGI
jgi:UDP-2-acetamido-2,6-beta-L-arabino-hexul-4-ose reductase